MSNAKVFAGLDYHEDSVRVCVLDAAGRRLGNRDLPNNRQAIMEWVQGHGQEVHAAIESRTGAASLADELIREGGWSVAMAHPGYVCRMTAYSRQTWKCRGGGRR